MPLTPVSSWKPNPHPQVSFSGKYPLGSNPVQLLLDNVKQLNGVLAYTPALRKFEIPGGIIISSQESLDVVLKFLKIPAAEFPKVDFKAQSVLFALQRCDGNAQSKNPAPKTSGDIPKTSLWEKNTTPIADPTLMTLTKLMYHRKDDVLIADVTQLPPGDEVAWVLAPVTNAAAYIQNADKSVALVRIDGQTTFNVSPE